MSSEKAFYRYVVIYDICISSERKAFKASKKRIQEIEKLYYTNMRRGKIARLLLEYGIRTQKSVYEIEITPSELKKLIKRINSIKEPQDKIYIYPFHKSAYNRTIRLGTPNPMIEHYFI